MNYYHLTADIELRSSSPEQEEPLVNPQENPEQVNDKSLVAQRITEIFESLQANEAVREPKPRLEAVRRRSSNPLSRQRRKLNTVSSYFSDWAKWLTSSSSKEVAANTSSKKHGYVH